MAYLVGLDQVKRHLRLPVTADAVLSEEDADLLLKIDQAEALVLDYVNQRREDDETVGTWAAEVESWSDITAPKQVIAAILMQTAELYRFRGDDTDAPKHEPGRLTPAIELFLTRLRDPAVA